MGGMPRAKLRTKMALRKLVELVKAHRPFRDYLDLFKFRSFEAKKSRHLDDLIRIYEIRRLSAESIYARSKLAALHCLRDVQTNAASTLSGVKQAKIANSHSFPSRCSST
jgi:hypothetical protein